MNERYTEEDIQKYAGLEKGTARPNDIRTAQAILNQRAEDYRAELSSGTKNLFNEQNLANLEKWFAETEANAKLLEKINKEQGEALQVVLAENKVKKELAALEKDYAEAKKHAIKVQKDSTASIEDLREATARVNDLQARFDILNGILYETKDITTEFNKAKEVELKLQTAENREKKTELEQLKKKNTEQDKALKKTAGQDPARAVAKEWKEIGSTLRSVINTLNINQIAQQFAPSSRQQLQQDIQTNFSINRKEFQSFKKSLFDQVDQSIYTTEDIIAAMHTLSSSTLDNTSTATMYFKDLVRGQKVLGMSSQTQETLLRLGNVTSRNELKFYTNQVAKFQQSSLGLNKRQLDELVSLNATLQSQAADLGIATTEFQQMSTSEQAAFESTNAGYGSKYTQALSNALVNTESTAAMLGMDSGELAERLARGESFIDMLRKGPGTQVALQALKSGDQAYISRIKENTMGALGIDENTWSILRVIAQQEIELNKNLRTATQASKSNSDAISEQEEKYGESLTIFQKAVNGISNFFNSNIDWTELEYLRSIDSVVKTIAVLLGAKDIFGGLGNILGKASKTGAGSKLLGKLGLTGAEGGGLNLAGLTIGNASGAAAWGGLGLTAAGIGIAGYDAYKMRNEKNGGSLRGFFLGTGHATATDEENTNAIMGNAAKWGLVGAGIGTFFGPGIGTAIGGGIGAIAGILMGGIGALMTSEEEDAEKTNEELELIRKNTYETAMNTSYQGIGMVYRYRGKSNYSSEAGPGTARSVGDVSYPISSNYGPRPPIKIVDKKTGKVTYTNPFHSGTDYAAPKGTPLYSNVTGTVMASGTDNAGGNYVGVTGKDGYTHWYWHLMKKSNVSKGQHVNAGQLVGYVGNTGVSGGPHLHFTVTKPGVTYPSPNPEKKTVNPIPFFTKNIFNGSSVPVTTSQETTESPLMSNLEAFRTKATSVSLSRFGDIAVPIVNSISDLKNTIINLSEQTSRNQKIMDALVNRTMQSTTI